MGLCWIMSVFWEITEHFYKFMLPNFFECWWDQWIFDVLLCNGIGIWLGIELCRWFEVKQYLWGSSCSSSSSSKQDTKLRLTRWDPLETRRRYVVCIVMVLVNQIVELNAFILKNIF